jgi:hypothetical protein
MKRFAIAAALAVAIGLGTAGTSDARPPGQRFFNPAQTFNMGAVRTFPSFNSSPFMRTSPFMRPSFGFNNGFGMNGFNNGFFVPPTLFPSSGPNFNGFGRRW